MSKSEMKVGETWLMKYRENGQIIAVRIVSLYRTAVEVEQRSNLIGWQRPEIVGREAVEFLEKVRGAP